jgi:hypothetical protein
MLVFITGVLFGLFLEGRVFPHTVVQLGFVPPGTFFLFVVRSGNALKY